MIDPKRLAAEIEDLSYSYPAVTEERKPLSQRYLMRERSFYIGDVFIKNPLIAAPLAGISDNTFRMFSSYFGSALNYSEMISSNGIKFKDKKSLDLAKVTGFERPCSIQIFGNDPDVMATAAKIIEEMADIIDINMGCPVHKILKSKSGGFLLKDTENAKRIMEAVIGAVSKPVTVKTRLGWDDDNNVSKIARAAQDLGISALCIHGRKVKQGYKGFADNGLSEEIAGSLKIPVIFSGDIDDPLKADRLLDSSNCKGIMIGRAIRARHHLLKDIYLNLNSKKMTIGQKDPGIGWVKTYLDLYLRSIISFKGEYRGIREFRKHFSWSLKGRKGAAAMRKKIFELEDISQALRLIYSIK